MKSKIAAIALFTTTAATVAFYPAYHGLSARLIADPPHIDVPAMLPVEKQSKYIDVVFVLDTTGSMSGLIQAAKEKIWSIATTMASANSAPEIRMGLVAYRDRGDDYVTQTVALTSDLDSVYAKLMDFKASGGGDSPESVNQALHEAVSKMSWREQKPTYKVVFLVGDAPPHMDYQDDVKYPVSLALAREKNIVVNTIQSGANSSTTAGWQNIARLGQGQYFQVGDKGNAVAIVTPFDEKLAKLSEKLDDTRLYYGSKELKEKKQLKIKAARKIHAAATPAAQARRATFNSSKSGNANFLGGSELIDDVSSGRVELSSIDKDKLPAPMQAMSVEERQAVISATADSRKKLRSEIKELAEKRSGYLSKKVKASGGAKDSLDEKIYGAVREQAGKSGLTYEDEAPAY